MPSAKKVDQDEGFKMATAYYDTFSKGAGKVVLKDLKEMYQDRSSYVLGYVSGDALEMAKREGERSVYLMIKSQIFLAKHPELFEEIEEAE